MINTKTFSNSVKKPHGSPIFSSKTFQNNYLTKQMPQTQKFNQAIQLRLRQNQNDREPVTHLSTQSACSSQFSQDRPVQERLKNFNKVLTDSLQRHSFLSKIQKSTINTKQINNKPKQEQRKSLSKMFDYSDRQQQQKNKSKEIFRQKTLPRTEGVTFALSTNSVSQLQDVTQSPKQSIAMKTSLFTQINTLLQSAHSGQKTGQSPPHSGSKRVFGSISYLRSSLGGNFSYKNVKSSSQYPKMSQSQSNQITNNLMISNYISLNKESPINFSQDGYETVALLRRLKILLRDQQEERKIWQSERETLLQNIYQAERELEERQKRVILPFNENINQIVEIDLMDTSPISSMNYRDQSFG